MVVLLTSVVCVPWSTPSTTHTHHDVTQYYCQHNHTHCNLIQAVLPCRYTPVVTRYLCWTCCTLLYTSVSMCGWDIYTCCYCYTVIIDSIAVYVTYSAVSMYQDPLQQVTCPWYQPQHVYHDQHHQQLILIMMLLTGTHVGHHTSLSCTQLICTYGIGWASVHAWTQPVT